MFHPNNPDEGRRQSGSLAPFHQSSQGENIAQAGPGGYAAVNVYQQVMPRQVDAETLETAYCLLQTMPTDTIPPITSIGASSRLRYRHNHLFVGRGDEMLKLARCLKGTAADGSGTPPVAVVTGLGGLGKTQLVAEWVHHYGHYFTGGVFWLSFADAKGVPTEIAQCRNQLIRELPPQINNFSQDEQVQLILSAWMSPLPRLLIFDNCEEEALLAQWLPPTGGCRILVTSRRDRWSPHLGLSHLRLDTLPRDESIALLRKYRTVLAQNDADDIAQEVGDLPLALHLAGSYLHQDEQLEAQTYLKLLRQAPLLHLQLDEDDPDGPLSPTQHDQHIGRTFAVSYQRLNAERAGDQQALYVLACVACLAPGEPIPSDLLTQAVLRLPEGTTESSSQTQRPLNKAVRRLSNLGLLEVSQNQVRQHRLLTAFVITIIDQGMMKQAQHQVEATLRDQARALDENYRLLAIQQWHQHLRVVTDRAMDRSDEQASMLCYWLAEYLYLLGMYDQALLYTRHALALSQEILGPLHPQTAANLHNVAVLYRNEGKYAEAETFHLQALAIREQVLGSQHPATARSLNNLAFLYDGLDKYEEAEPLYLRALAIYEKVLGSQHPATATSLNNLAALYQGQGKYAEAEPLYQRALAIREQGLGSQHPATATSLNSLATLYQDRGKYEEAKPLYLRALAIREQELGAQHPDTATSLHYLAFLYDGQGKYEEAEPLYLRALAIYEKVLGSQHPATATSLNDLAALYQHQSRYAEAEPLYLRALAIYEKVLGSQHPHTAISLNNLAGLYREQGKYEEAEPLYLRTLAIREQVLGSQHPATARSLSNLAALYRGQGRYTEAEPLFLRALAIYEKVLGSQHPHTATILNNLAGLYLVQGKYKEAKVLYQRLQEIRDAQSGQR